MGLQISRSGCRHKYWDGAAGESKKEWGLAHLNNFENRFMVASALTGITSNFTSPKLPIQSKSACQPQNHKSGRSRSRGAPGKSEARRAA